MLPTAYNPADILLVHRKRTFSSFAAGPKGFMVSRRIQILSRSPWNHAGILTGSDTVVEADWDGVAETSLDKYRDERKYELGFVRMPSRSGNQMARTDDRLRALKFALDQVGFGNYDWRLIAMMGLASILWGTDGIRRVSQDRDDVWICSELAWAAWRDGGVGTTASSANIVQTPGDFARFWPVRDLQSGFIIGECQ